MRTHLRNGLAAILLGVLVTTTAACTSAPNKEDREAAACTIETYLHTKSELRDWWGGASLPVTWKVTETKNEDWGSQMRPDHAPPEGVQGLTQTVESGTHRQAVDMSAGCNLFDTSGGANSYGDRLFTLTPVVNIDGSAVELDPMWIGYDPRFEKLVPYYVASGKPRVYRCGEPQGWSYDTPRGTLMYQVVVECDQSIPSPDKNYDRNSVIVIRNFRR